VAAAEPPAGSAQPPAASTAEVISTLTGRLDVLTRLGAARDSGILTEEEFRSEQERVMAL
jgi:hypothetical protein